MRSITCTERYSEVTECEATAKEPVCRYVILILPMISTQGDRGISFGKYSRWVINFKDKRSENQLNPPGQEYENISFFQSLSTFTLP